MTGITFNPTDHTYTTDGRVVPSVTQILKAVGAYGPGAGFWGDDSRQRGTLVHRLVAAYNYGMSIDQLRPMLREEPCRDHPKLAGYLAAWVNFTIDYQIRVRRDGIEAVVWHSQLNYAGQTDCVTDRWGIAPGEPQTRILDLKTGQVPGGQTNAHTLQTEAYRFAWNYAQIPHDGPLTGRSEGYAVARAAVYLRPNGKYKYVEHTAILADANGWAAALAAYPWSIYLRNNNLLERRDDE